MKRIWTWIKNHKKTSIFACIVLAGVVLFTSRGDKPPVYETTTAQKRTVVQEVGVTGKVIPAREVTLAFERSGRVYRTFVKVGDHVREGQLLSQLASADLAAQLRQSSASASGSQALLGQYTSAVAREQARLDEMRHGSTPLEVSLSQTKVTNANFAVADAQASVAHAQTKADTDLVAVYENMKTVLDDAYIKADDAVNRTTEPMFENDTTSNPRLNFLTRDLSQGSMAETQRYSAGQAVIQMRTLLQALPSEPVARTAALQNARTVLNTFQTFLATMSIVVNDALGLSAATHDAYRADIAAARSGVNTATTNVTKQLQLVDTTKANNAASINAAQSALTSVQNALSIAKRDFELTLAGPRPEQIRAQEQAVAQATASFKAQQATVNAAWANVAQVEALLGQARITAPFSGIITKQDAKAGQVASAMAPLMGLMADTQYEIEAFVPEVDIAKLQTQDRAMVTLDAYGPEQQFEARVIDIDPAETVKEGVSTYRIRLQFTNNDDRIKPGMTANMDIRTDERVDVIAVPARAVTRHDDKKFVRILKNENQIEEREVTTGLVGSDGLVEITGALQPEERVILYVSAD